MHILVTADTIGGVWTYTRELVTGLHSRGHRITLVSFGDIPTAEQSAWMNGLQRIDFRPTAFRLEWMQDAESDLVASSDFLLALIRESKPDLLHLSQFYFGDIDCSVPRLVVAHSDVCTWWQAVHGKEPPDSEWIRGYRSTVARAVRGADVIVAPSRWMLDSFQRVHGACRTSAVIYNGRAPNLFNPNLPKQDFALSVGRIWDLGKNSILLSRIGSPLPVYLVGNERDPANGPDGPLSHIEGTALSFKGPKEECELRELLAKARIYIVTSQYEPFGLAPLEAAFSRCAIVATDIASLREIWGDAAIYFTSNDALSLHHTLESLWADPGKINAFAVKAYKRATRYYTSSAMIDGYRAIYQNLVGTGVEAA